MCRAASSGTLEPRSCLVCRIPVWQTIGMRPSNNSRPLSPGTVTMGHWLQTAKDRAHCRAPLSPVVAAVVVHDTLMSAVLLQLLTRKITRTQYTRRGWCSRTTYPQEPISTDTIASGDNSTCVQYGGHSASLTSLPCSEYLAPDGRLVPGAIGSPSTHLSALLTL